MDMDDDFIGEIEFELSAEQGELVSRAIAAASESRETSWGRVRADQSADRHHAVVGDPCAGGRKAAGIAGGDAGRGLPPLSPGARDGATARPVGARHASPLPIVETSPDQLACRSLCAILRQNCRPAPSAVQENSSMKRQEMVFDPFQLIDKKDRKALTRRNDRSGLGYLCGHFAAIGVSGTGIYLVSGTLFMVPMMLVHGILLACLFAPMHECSHGTAFRTRTAQRSRLLVRELRLHHPAHLVSLPSRRPPYLHADPGHGSGHGAAQPDHVAALFRAAPGMAPVDDVSRRHHQACARPHAPAGFLVCAQAGSAAHLQRGPHHAGRRMARSRPLRSISAALRRSSTGSFRA